MFDNQKFACLINDTLIEENRTFSECFKNSKEAEYFAVLMENLVITIFNNMKIVQSLFKLEYFKLVLNNKKEQD